jgi:hypothetical protein
MLSEPASAWEFVRSFGVYSAAERLPLSVRDTLDSRRLQAESKSIAPLPSELVIPSENVAYIVRIGWALRPFGSWHLNPG